MKDKYFGRLEWGDFERWETGVTVESFRDFGTETYISDDDRDPGSLDPDFLSRQGKFLLVVETGGIRKAPSESQRQTWAKFIDRGEAISQGLLTKLLAEYHLQRSARVKWWKAMYGDAPYEKDLPEVHDISEIRRLVRPYHIRLHDIKKGSAAREIDILCRCTWYSEGCGVLVRDGAITKLGKGAIAVSSIVPQTEIDHSPFGSLRRMNDNAPWVGEARLSRFTEFQSIAQDRAAFRQNPTQYGPPTSKLDWNFSRGEFTMLIHAKPKALPTRAQAEAFAAFKADESGNSEAIVNSVYQNYVDTYEQRRLDSAGREPHIELALPKIDKVGDLAELITLSEVNVFPDSNSSPPAIGFGFSLSGGGIGVKWSDGKIEKVGLKNAGRP